MTFKKALVTVSKAPWAIILGLFFVPDDPTVPQIEIYDTYFIQIC